MASDVAARLEAAKQELSGLKATIEKQMASLADTTFPEVASDVAAMKVTLKLRRTLKGHLAKVYSIHWAEDNRSLVSASQDGRLIVWNAFTTNKSHAIPLRSSWVMTCAYAPSGTLVACGGLDNLCSIYNIAGENPTRVQQELSGHAGYLSCARFINDQQIVTASGDNTCVLWDFSKGVPITTFNGHESDVMALALNQDKNLFVSAGCDCTAKLWDIRAGSKSMRSFSGHESDINAVAFFPDGQAFCSGSDDTSVRLFDLRANRELMLYKDDRIISGTTSVAFSHSGRLIFAGRDDVSCGIWDTLKGTVAGSLVGHEGRVSCVGVPPDGMVVCTGSWDSGIRIWA
eukprot:TRINITY_DN390_c0_g1_i2.p1 TRINITY_DN390_c0_g1~~TRINITY_DN390_c0_g1_i2.p1  ORF type:complete len:361 (+),score=74.69 TRINITY_DN390_c0_g1_i2:51-1085(+)